MVVHPVFFFRYAREIQGLQNIFVMQKAYKAVNHLENMYPMQVQKDWSQLYEIAYIYQFI